MKNVLVVMTVGALSLAGAHLLAAADETMAGCPMKAAQAGAVDHHADAADNSMQGCPMHATHADSVDHRGDEAMGFDHSLTDHHFLLQAAGGVIEVLARTADDSGSISAIRQHLAHVAKMFAAGDFDVPMFIHDQVPPGVPVMKGMKDAIQYRFEEEPRGGRILITSDQSKAISAVHDFLRFQIDEHRTGDSPAVQ